MDVRSWWAARNAANGAPMVLTGSTGPGDDAGLVARVPAAPRGERSNRTMKGWLRWLAWGQKPEPVPSHLGPVEDPQPGAIGICSAGGGIRAAAFNLGALQALQERGVLRRARYLAAVSGGSYIVAAFLMVGRRRRAADPPGDDSDPALLAAQPPFARGSPEEEYLRNRCAYMAPGPMGKLRLALRVLVGLLVNLTLVLSFLVIVGTVLAAVYRWLYPGLVHGTDTLGHSCTEQSATNPCTFDAGIDLLAWGIPAAIGALGAAFSAWSILRHFRSDRWTDFFETWALRLVIVGAGLAVLLVAVPLMVEWIRNLHGSEAVKAQNSGKPPVEAVTGVGGAGVLSILLAVMLQLRAKLAEPARVLEKEVRGARQLWQRLGTKARNLFVYFVATVAGPLALTIFTLVIIAARLHHEGVGHWLFIVGCGVVLAALWVFGDLTSWSLHPFYRRQLATAFALKRVRRDARDAVGEAQERDYAQVVSLDEATLDGWPTVLICAAANISDAGATPPGRAVTSFTLSPYAVGGPLVGAVETGTFLGDIPQARRRDYSLLAATAMSGAALSPSMGKSTRHPLRFLMALANVRLGVWVPNPRHAHRLRERLFVPRPNPSYLMRELLGINHVNARYLYVTDGGHYESLGLVEVLRRGCTDVLCFDASGGQSFAALGDAVALARSELGVEVDIDPSPLVPHGERSLADADFAVGRIRFPGGQTGRLIYARTVMTAAAPWDVHAYHEADRTFPHDPSADQLYTDQKFEAYRVLGECAGRHAADVLEAPARARRNGRVARASTVSPAQDPGPLLRDQGVDVAR